MNTAKLSLGETIYEFPLLYKWKINILNKLNGLPININPLIENKKILDIGCGSYQTRYNTAIARKRVGIDPSARAIMVAKKLYPKDKHVVGVAEKLPFPNKSFDVSLLLYVLHHIERKKWNKVLREAKRVTKHKIIIFDHVRNKNSFFSLIQLLYWKNIDGGDYYAKNEEWENLLEKFNVSIYKRFGKLFNHICFYQLSLKKK